VVLAGAPTVGHAPLVAEMGAFEVSLGNSMIQDVAQSPAPTKPMARLAFVRTGR